MMKNSGKDGHNKEVLRTTEQVTQPYDQLDKYGKGRSMFANLFNLGYVVIHNPESHVAVQSHKAHLSPQRSLEFVSCSVPLA